MQYIAGNYEFEESITCVSTILYHALILLSDGVISLQRYDAHLMNIKNSDDVRDYADNHQ